MLQREQEKANKKIRDTSKKTEELLARRDANDAMYANVSKRFFTDTLDQVVNDWEKKEAE